MNIVCVDPRDDPLWSTLAHQCPYSSVFNSPAWLRVLANTYGWIPEAYIVVDDNGQPLAGIAYFRVTDEIGERIVSLPFSDFCDPLVDEPAQWLILADQLARFQCQISLRCVHNNLPLEDERYDQPKRAKWHGIHLDDEPDRLWRKLDRTARQSIERAKETGVTVEPACDKNVLRIFFETHLQVRKYKYHMLAQPYLFFENIWDEFIAPGQGVLLQARCRNRFIAGGLFLIWKNGLYYKFNTSDHRNLDHRPNDLLVWEGIQFAKARGLELFDFGLSDWDQDGLIRYKRKFNTFEKTISFLTHIPDDAVIDQQKRVRSIFPKFTDLLTESSVPDSVTEHAGEVFYRFFT